MASTSKEKEVSSLPKEDGSQHDDAMQEDPESYKAVEVWDIDFILEKLRHTECSLLLERTFDSNTLLHVAAILGHDQIVEAILSIQQCQELLTAKNSSGDLPLHVASNAGHLSIVQHLVKFSYRCQELLTPKNSGDNIPLSYPPLDANAGYQPSVDLSDQKLQDRYTSKLLRLKNKEGNTPLHLALIKKYEEDSNLKTNYHDVAKFLIEKDPTACTDLNEANKYPLDLAIKAQDKELQDLMSSKLQPQREINEEGNTQVMEEEEKHIFGKPPPYM